ncbi:early nodulin-75-like [Drosophila subpulchrella]|uniref:early nodulin-75-like n=1 Tax=Drosophila subpulchrella TaxID=1486046 RepID=UPI0018A1691F|nr:early nodulin-75-like [Drosophila subpulchrella]
MGSRSAAPANDNPLPERHIATWPPTKPSSAYRAPSSAHRAAQQRHPRRQPRYQQRRPSSVPRRAVPPTWPSGAHRAPPAAPTAAPTTAPDTWSPATQRASPGARNERPRALSGVICTTSSTHRVPTECPPSATSSAHQQHPPRYKRHQERPTISAAAHQPHSPSANGSASRNHIGQPVPHVSSTCRAPSAQSRH